MASTRLAQLIAANQLAGALWLVLSVLVFGVPPLADPAGWLGVLLGLIGVGAGYLVIRDSRPASAVLAVLLLLQTVRVATAQFAWQLILGANWRVEFAPHGLGTTFGFDELFSLSPWPANTGSILEVNVTALVTALFLLVRLYRTPTTLAKVAGPEQRA